MNIRKGNFASFGFGITLLALSGGAARLAAQASPQEQAAPAPAPASSEAASTQPQTSPATIKKESRLVLVDAVVTDKKRNYIRHLSAKDIQIYTSNKEQPV